MVVGTSRSGMFRHEDADRQNSNFHLERPLNGSSPFLQTPTSSGKATMTASHSALLSIRPVRKRAAGLARTLGSGEIPSLRSRASKNLRVDEVYEY